MMKTLPVFSVSLNGKFLPGGSDKVAILIDGDGFKVEYENHCETQILHSELYANSELFVKLIICPPV